MKEIAKVLAAVLSVVVFFGTVLWLLLWQPVWLFHREDFRTGDQIISRVEEFRKSHKRLPETLNDVGFDDPDLNVYYRKVSGDEYIVWFGTSLGESETFNSRTKKWD